MADETIAVPPREQDETEIPGSWPGPVARRPFAGRPNAAEGDPGRLRDAELDADDSVNA
jgi:hypothetical protein